jgi:hypothetical protein
MRTFWTILGIAGALVLLVLVGVAIAVWTIDVNQFIAPIATRVKDATGRDLSIGGGIALELGLEPKVVASDVRFGNARWAREPHMLTAKRVEADVALLPLLQRRFELLRLNLVEPTIALETDASGKHNWEFAESGSTAGSAAAAAGGAASALASFGVGNVEVTDGILTYRDDASGSTTRVTIDRFVAQARSPGSPINAEFRGKIDDVPVALSGNLGPLDTLLSPRAIRSPWTQGRRPAGERCDRCASSTTLSGSTIDLGLGMERAASGRHDRRPRPKLSLARVDRVVARGSALPLNPVPASRSADKAKPPARVSATSRFACRAAVDRHRWRAGDRHAEAADGRRLDGVRALHGADGAAARDVGATLFGGTVRAATSMRRVPPTQRSHSPSMPVDSTLQRCSRRLARRAKSKAARPTLRSTSRPMERRSDNGRVPSTARCGSSSARRRSPTRSSTSNCR